MLCVISTVGDFRCTIAIMQEKQQKKTDFICEYGCTLPVKKTQAWQMLKILHHQNFLFPNIFPFISRYYNIRGF